MPSDRIDDLELPSSLELRTGEEWVVRLPGLGSAGYGWHAELGDPTVIESSLSAAETDVGATPGGPPPDAHSVDQLLTLRALRAGRTTVRLLLARPWETTQRPQRSHHIVVVVE